MEFYAGNIIRLGVLLFLLCGALGATIKGEDGAERDSAQGLKRILDTAFDKLSIELARGYIIRKHARFPNQIKTVDDLEAYLHRLYPNEGHELRQALLRLRLYKKSFDGDGGTIRDFMKNGLGLYAVNLDGRPMAYDRAKVEAIISEAVVQANQLKLGAMGNRTDKAAKEIKKLGATPGGANNFINRNSPLVMGLFVAAGLGLCCWLFIKRMGKKPESNSPEPDAADKGAHTGVASPAPEYKALPEEETVIVSGQGSESLPEIVAAAAVAAPPAPDTESETRSPSDNGTRSGEWLVVRTSLPGKLHTESNPPIPCQDSNDYQDIGQGWGIAVVCDGAGSKAYSHYGSRFVTQKAGCYFREIVEQNNWQMSATLPTQAEWHEAAKRAFARIRDNLEGYAGELGFNAGLLSCTVIVIIHSPNGVLATHIGDGRAAFCNSEQQWKALIKPHKGEEANYTVFLTSIDWSAPDKYIESTVFEEKPVAFTLMSDGCESHSFEVNIFDEQEQKYTDPNRPYPGFFQPLVATLRNLHHSRAGREEIDAKWERFIQSGSEKLKNEPDDKTMILGVLLD